jgi:hypothetical protein
MLGDFTVEVVTFVVADLINDAIKEWIKAEAPNLGDAIDVLVDIIAAVVISPAELGDLDAILDDPELARDYLNTRVQEARARQHEVALPSARQLAEARERALERRKRRRGGP